MAFLTFRGGIHPYDGKDLSKNCPVEKYLPKGDLAILVSQHIGAPAKPIVKKGDHVLAGQKIAEAGGFVSAPIHSSVSGTVKGIEKRLTAVGAMGDAIIIENVSVRICGICTCKAFGSFQGGYPEKDSGRRSCWSGWCRFPDTCKALTKGTRQDRSYPGQRCGM